MEQQDNLEKESFQEILCKNSNDSSACAHFNEIGDFQTFLQKFLQEIAYFEQKNMPKSQEPLSKTDSRPRFSKRKSAVTSVAIQTS
jgi:hypothetical protein